ncbi:MAG: methyltransferase domain-containing protein [Gemmatimonadota bacterium]
MSCTGDGARNAKRPRAPADSYGRCVRSEEYREERARKAEVILALCETELRAALRIADLGAGTGLIKKSLEVTLDKYIYGFDIDISFIARAEGMVVADVRWLPVRAAWLDFLILNHVYEHVTDQTALFREAARVLRPGGCAYVSAGNRLAVMEPHYRLPMLSWLPRGLAGAYVRASRRGTGYEGIRFRTYGVLVKLMREAGFQVEDITERAFDRLLRKGGWPVWRVIWRTLAAFPRALRGPLLRAASPQWFFLLRRPAEVSGDGRGMEPERARAAREGRSGRHPSPQSIPWDSGARNA